MKKQSNKEVQGYKEKAEPNFCSNCIWYKSVLSKTEYGYMQEKEIRCGLGDGLGGFAIKKQGVCNHHEKKVEK